MFTKLFLIFFIKFYLCQLSFCVDDISTGSLQYDRRLLKYRQCLLNEQYRTDLRSSSSYTSANARVGPGSIRRPLIVNNGDDQLTARASSHTFSVDDTDPLEIDRALFMIVVDQQITGNFIALLRVVECIDCPYETVEENLSSTKSVNLTLNTQHTYRIRIELSNKSLLCDERVTPREHGYYSLNVQMSSSPSTDSNLQCTVTTVRSPNNIYIPLIVAAVALLILFVACLLGQRLKVREYLMNFKNRSATGPQSQQAAYLYDLQARPPTTAEIGSVDTPVESPVVAKVPTTETVSNVMVPKSKRLLSLDAFRGFALISMIFVNYGGGGYAQFEHAPWHGITFADIVFPFFVWMLGTSLVFSLKSGIDKQTSKRILLKRVAIRTLKLFLIGFILNTRSRVDLYEVRIPGVLQRFAVVYGVIATIEVLCTRPKQYLIIPEGQTLIPTTTKLRRIEQLKKQFFDIINFPLQWLVVSTMVLLWILVIYLVPFENCPAGYLGPGGLHKDGKYENCTGGITGYIDRIIFTNKHLYNYPTCQTVYDCKAPFDPENLFGAIPTIFLAFLGVQAGRILVMYQKDRDRLIRFFAWSVVSLSIGIGLSGGRLDSGPMPLNKNLWTLSFSFFTAGLAFACFSIMYILIDMKKWWTATPFQYPGANSILLYISHSIFENFFPVQWQVAETHTARLALALWGCIFWIIVAYICFLKRFFLVL